MAATKTKSTNKAARDLREAIAGVSTGCGSDYYNKPSEALRRITELLKLIGLQLRDMVSWNDYAETYRTTFYLETEDGQPLEDAMILFSWYRMPSGRYEITTYLS